MGEPQRPKRLKPWKESGHDDLQPPEMAQEGSKAFDYVWEKEGCQLMVPISAYCVRVAQMIYTYMQHMHGTASDSLRFGQDSCEKRQDS